MGHAPAKVDEKGRLKVPTSFRRVVEERYGEECFTTSLDGEKAIIYPLPIYREFQARLSRVPSTSAAKNKMMAKLNYFGQLGSIDTQGRLLIPSILREVAEIQGEVVVLGKEDHLEVWSSERIQKRMMGDPLTLDDLKELELHGV